MLTYLFDNLALFAGLQNFNLLVLLGPYNKRVVAHIIRTPNYTSAHAVDLLYCAKGKYSHPRDRKQGVAFQEQSIQLLIENNRLHVTFLQEKQP